MTAAHRWLMTLSTIRPGLRSTAILAQVAEGPTTIRPDGQQWRFHDGSTLEIDGDGVRAMPAVNGQAEGTI
jgi:hypothetical protein